MPDKPRFLITTADERSWRVDRPVLFLGGWCRLHDRRNVWRNLDATVAPAYGWGRGQQDTDYTYVQGLYEQLLVELSAVLNSYHGTNHSLRYWRILLGLWLCRFTSIAFNRWATLQFVLQHHAITGTVVLDFPKEQVIANDSDAFTYAYIGDAWNHALCGRILSGWTDVRIERVAADVAIESTRISMPAAPVTLKRRLKKIAARMASKLSSTLSRPTDALVISSYLPLKQDLRLQLALGQIPKLWRTPATPRVAPDFQARDRLRLNTDGHDGFEQCIRTLIPEQIPVCYLEGYPALLGTVAKLPWPKNPKVIFTGNRFDTDEIFKAWTAAKVEEGAPYVIGQHGGYYGTARYSPSETHEVATADRYLTWGWTENNSKHYPAAALKVIGLSPGRWNPSGGLLLITVSGDHPDTPWDQTSGFAKYLEQQFVFIETLSPHINKKAIVRLHAWRRYLTWSEENRWRTHIPDAQLDLGDRPIQLLIGQSRLTVHSYNSTGILETLALNIPTLCFWNTEHWGLRPSAQPYFDRLKQAGVFHDTPESAAAKVAEVWDDVAGWWNRPEVQEARRYFCERFARLPENPIQILKEALMTVKPEQGARTNSRRAI